MPTSGLEQTPKAIKNAKQYRIFKKKKTFQNFIFLEI
jgi:hypothetical protein